MTFLKKYMNTELYTKKQNVMQNKENNSDDSRNCVHIKHNHKQSLTTNVLSLMIIFQIFLFLL